MRDNVRDGKHHKIRKVFPVELLKEYDYKDFSPTRKSALLTKVMCEAETPYIGSDENIVFTRTIKNLPNLYSKDEWDNLFGSLTLHELGPISNVCVDWEILLSQGLLKRKTIANQSLIKYNKDNIAKEFLESAILTIDSVLSLTKKYSQEAKTLNRLDLVSILEKVPARPPESFHEALQFLRICHSVIWMSGNYHVGLGRFDQYMWKYLEKDLNENIISKENAMDLLIEFFICLNKDSDLYVGLQQGDNGQSIMLGGVKPNGKSGVNLLTEMSLKAAGFVAMIDPKINLRISQNTDIELLKLATKLTKHGLGFPQYSNDDIVIPALIKNGYSIEDARNYTVAACWEFIIPGKGMEIVNIGAISLPAAVDYGIRKGLKKNKSFEDILNYVNDNILEQVNNLCDIYKKLYLIPSPFYSVLMSNCLENGKDMSLGLKYNNLGIHGACSASAADALAIVKKYIYENNILSKKELLVALENNFNDNNELLNQLRNDELKVGNNNQNVDKMLVKLFDMSANICEKIQIPFLHDKSKFRSIRLGSGSAMYYIWLAQGYKGMREPLVEATADGRKKDDVFGANLSPSPNIEIAGPISVMQSFSKIDYERVYNGGPITIEISDMVFKNNEGLTKVAMLVKTFTKLNCQQLQLNTLNIEKLQKAINNPKQYKNLIVRVWGWSGYFCELDKVYQNHILDRHIYHRFSM